MCRRFLLVFCCCGLAAGSASGYGPTGHQTVGKIAAVRIAGTRAAREVAKLLRSYETMETASTWADRAKFPDKYLSDEMKEYISLNPAHRTFHYCDIPFQQKEYRATATGARDRDIVHVLNLCIAILRNPDAAPDNPLGIDKRIALLLTIHLIGDLHQPLHVGSAYVDSENRLVDPDIGVAALPDAGGNNFRMGKTANLHGYWDNQAVKSARAEAGDEDLAGWLIRRFPPQSNWKAAGPIFGWPAEWATDTLQVSARCFDGISPSDRILVPGDEKHGERFQWQVALPPDYADRARDIVELELAKGGYRLAALLKAIWPEP